VIDANDKECRNALSQHPIRNTFYEGICLGGNKRGIHGMSPGEPLHVLELGLFKMMIKGFYVNLGYKPGSTSYPKILQLLDVWAVHLVTKATEKCREHIFLMVLLVEPS
jgi:hypothetical protein